MKSFSTIIKDKTKDIILLADYLLWLLLDPSKFTKIDKKKVKRVLIIHTGAIGELIITSVLLPFLKKQLNCEIIYMIDKGKEEILKNNPYVSKIIFYEKDFKKNVQKLKKENFNLALILFKSSLRNSFICLLAGIKYRIGGFAGVRSSPMFLFNKRIFPIGKRHSVEETLEIIRQIGLKIHKPRLEVYFSEKDKKNAEKKLKKIGIKEYLIIHPGFGFVGKTSSPSRLWPIERYAELIDYIANIKKMNVLITGSEEEKVLCDKIIKKSQVKKKVFLTNGLFNLSELIYIISKAKLLIAPGTSVIHIASAVDTPIIELMGKETPEEWGPWMDKVYYRIIYHNEGCTGCNDIECKRKTNECLKAISVSEVIKAFEELPN